MIMRKTAFVSYLDDLLKNQDFVDNSRNGLQVDSSKDEMKKIMFTEDISNNTIDEAIKMEADMIVAHH